MVGPDMELALAAVWVPPILGVNAEPTARKQE
jgi:hypothetical protein